jgi:large subunit ribosomal protein L25
LACFSTYHEMKSVPLKAYTRAGTRRAAAATLRRAGRIPAVIYGRQHQPQNLEVVARELSDLMHAAASENLLFDLAVEGDARAKRLALLQEVQHHPVGGHVLHVDFHEVAEDEKVTIMVPVETTGEAAGVKTGGGVLEHVMFRLRVRALPKDLPEVLTLDVTSLEVGKAIHIGDIQPPAGVEILGERAQSVVACAIPRAEVEETPAAETEAAAGDVEMIKEKKEDGSEGGEAKPVAKGAAKPGDKATPKAGEKAAPEKGAEKPAEKKK